MVLLTNLKIDRSFFIVQMVLHVPTNPTTVTGWVLVEIITSTIGQMAEFCDWRKK